MYSIVAIHALFIGLLIGVLDYFANKLYFYWTIPWFDILMHFLAGFLIAFVCVLLRGHFSRENFLQTPSFVYFSITVSIVIGVLWEYYELHFGLASLSHGMVYYKDTVSDLLLDFFGTYAGILYIRLITNKK